jgi:predicted nucleic acid-binding protein
VLAEVAHFIERRLGTRVELRFLEDLAAGAFFVEPPRASDWIRVAELVTRYADARLGMVDASIVAAAERLGITRIATLDRRHFGIVRPAHTDLFDVVP